MPQSVTHPPVVSASNPRRRPALAATARLDQSTNAAAGAVRPQPRKWTEEKIAMTKIAEDRCPELFQPLKRTHQKKA